MKSVLLNKGVPADSNALGAHGYRRVVEYLDWIRDLKAPSNKPNSTCAITASGN